MPSMNRLLLVVLLALPASLFAQPYLGGGFTIESADDTVFADRDCSSTQPPALFGCGAGNDNHPFSARGELRRGIGFELNLGHQFGRTRAGVVVTSRSGRDLEAESNFTGVTGEQPVSARVRSLSLLFEGAVDLAPERWTVHPFVIAGAGVARNELGEVTFAFPGISPDAVTITQGGETTGFAWSYGAGFSVELPRGLHLDVTARHTDLGRIVGDEGEALIVRPTRVLRLNIDATEMKWKTDGLTVSVRQSF
jgi:opacity protein-like surface antigen